MISQRRLTLHFSPRKANSPTSSDAELSLNAQTTQGVVVGTRSAVTRARVLGSAEAAEARDTNDVVEWPEQEAVGGAATDAAEERGQVLPYLRHHHVEVWARVHFQRVVLAGGGDDVVGTVDRDDAVVQVHQDGHAEDFDLHSVRLLVRFEHLRVLDVHR